MQLLVSVRDADEAALAVRGGADIIDAKEPSAGGLGPVSPRALAAIREAVPAGKALSAALGDVALTEDVDRALDRVTVPLDFVKLGFRCLPDPMAVRTLLARAVSRLPSLPGRPVLIAVTCADWRRAGSLNPAAFPVLVHESGAGGLLLDTAFKDAGALPSLLSPDELAELGRDLRKLGQRFAVGGSLTAEDLPLARAIGAGIFGVRGAACEGGRLGRVTHARVELLATALANPRVNPGTRGRAARRLTGR